MWATTGLVRWWRNYWRKRCIASLQVAVMTPPTDLLCNKPVCDAYVIRTNCTTCSYNIRLTDHRKSAAVPRDFASFRFSLNPSAAWTDSAHAHLTGRHVDRSLAQTQTLPFTLQIREIWHFSAVSGLITLHRNARVLIYRQCSENAWRNIPVMWTLPRIILWQNVQIIRMNGHR